MKKSSIIAKATDILLASNQSIEVKNFQESHAIEMSKEASEYGADGLLLVTPYYNKATQAGLVAHFSAVAKEVTAPIIMYSVASRTGCNIEPATVARLVKQLEE